MIIKDGNEIVDGSKIFKYKNGSYSAFSNYFRFNLLYQKGGYWVDADLLCVRPFKLEQPIVIAGEPDRSYKNTSPTSFMIKLPAGSEIAEEAVRVQEEQKVNFKWRNGMGSGPATIKH